MSRKHTIYKVQDKLAKSDCEAIIAEFEKLKNDTSISVSKKGDTRIFGFERFISSAISEHLFQADKGFLKQNGQPDPSWQTLMVNKTSFDVTGNGSGDGWHRDSLLSYQQKTIFYLVPVSQDSGPFTLIVPVNPVVERYFPCKTRIDNDHNYVQNLGKQKMFTCDNEGFGFSAVTNYVHRGMPLVSGTRYAATVYSYTKKPPQHIVDLATK